MAKSKRILLDDEMQLEAFFISFLIGTNPDKLEESKILFCKELIKEFMRLGVTFNYTFDIDNPKFTFNATKQDGLPRVTIFYEFSELGISPRCFWSVQGSLENFDFTIDQLPFFKECSGEVIEKWRKDCTI